MDTKLQTHLAAQPPSIIRIEQHPPKSTTPSQPADLAFASFLISQPNTERRALQERSFEPHFDTDASQTS